MIQSNARRGNTQDGKVVIKNKVILNLIQDLQRTSLLFLNNRRGKWQIKSAMFTLRHSSSRPCGRQTVRDIGADHTLYPALQACGVTERVARGFTARFVIPQGRYAGYSGRVGFTLIELLVVVLIIGLLAAVALPQYNKAVEKARVAEGLTIMNAMQKAIDLYILEHGFPQGEDSVEFFAPTTSENFVPLDIEAAQGLTCKMDGYGTRGFCYKNRLAYHAYCTSDACYMSMADILPEWLEAADYAVGDWEHYSVNFQKYAATPKWTKICYGAICTGLTL